MMMQGLAMGGAEKRIKYGYLYNWYVTQGTGDADIANTGWNVITYAQMNALRVYLNDNVNAGGKLKDVDLAYWTTPNTGATNIYNFAIRGAGYRNNNGVFLGINTNTYLWTYLLLATPGIMYPFTHNSAAFTDYDTQLPTFGMSIRVTRPATAPEQSSLADGTWCEDYIGNDGQQYKTVKIGTQVWTAENLAETKYRGGTDITNVTDNTVWAALTTGARCAYGNNESNVFI